MLQVEYPAEGSVVIAKTDNLRGNQDSRNFVRPLTIKPIEIGILVRTNSLLGSVHGLRELFCLAEGLARRRAGHVQPLLHVSFLHVTASAVESVGDLPPRIKAKPTIIIVPPRETIALGREGHAVAARWLAECHREGAMLAAVCGGVFLLAETGLLGGRTVTTHWACAEELKAMYPDVRVDVDQTMIDDGDVLTAGGVMSWADLGLRIVERLLGRAVMIETARFMMIEPSKGARCSYRQFTPPVDHGDAAILLTQRHLEALKACRATVKDMARWAGLEERTFTRRFQRATGIRPNEYCQRVRIDGARILLESTTLQITQIAMNVGYGDAASFRKTFSKVIGLSPSQFRRRFGPPTSAAGGADPNHV